MAIKPVALLSAMLLIQFATSSLAATDKIYLNCKTLTLVTLGLDIQLNEDNQGSATLVQDDDKQVGSAVANDYFFHLAFPASGSWSKSMISINRYTGKLKWEVGEDPFGEENPANQWHNGTCEAAFRKF